MIRKGQLLSESVLNAAFMSKSEYNSILGDITTIGSMTAETVYVTGNNLEVGGKNDNATSLWLKRTASSHAWRVKNEGGILSFMGGDANASLERMRISSTGEVSIGTTTGGYKLYVNGSINSSSIYIGGAQKNLNWDAAFTHKSNNGSDHSYINQSVTTAASPSFTGLTVTNTISGKISGNAGTATKLATARTINGVDFDGSANIDVNLNSSLIPGNGLTGSSFNGSLERTFSIASHAGTAGSIGTINIGATTVGVNLGTTSITAFRGDYGNTAYAHVSSNGSSHSYINQSVTTSATPTFAGNMIIEAGTLRSTTGAFNIVSNSDTWWQRFRSIDSSVLTDDAFSFDQRQGTGDYVKLASVTGEGKVEAMGGFKTGNFTIQYDTASKSLSFIFNE